MGNFLPWSISCYFNRSIDQAGRDRYRQAAKLAEQAEPLEVKIGRWPGRRHQDNWTSN